MKMFVVFGILVHVSQHALAGVVEVNERAESVLIPCFYEDRIPEYNPEVIWTREDLNPDFVHLRRDEEDDLKYQNQVYRERTSMRLDALDTRNFSLTLRKPKLSDTGNYICSIRNKVQERRVTEVQLKVKDQEVEVKSNEGEESVSLPCSTKPDLPEDVTVEWTRSGPETVIVHVYKKLRNDNNTKSNLCNSRTKMNKDLLRTGDLSLTLKYPTERDSGDYICTVYRNEDILRQKVVLKLFKERFPVWTRFLLVFLILVLIGSGCVLFYFRWYFMSVYKVEVGSGEKSVLLPCRTTVSLGKDAKVEWTDHRDVKVHVFENGSDQPEQQDHLYRTRTKLNKIMLKYGDLSLTLEQPTEGDSGTFTCIIYSSEKNILMKKQVQLEVKVCQVEVEKGAESVLLPFRTSKLPEEAEVEWLDSKYRKVHVFENNSDKPEKQNQFYKNRTKMNRNLRRTGDLSLTLKHPTDKDSGTFACTVFGSEGNILKSKQVQLEVKDGVIRSRSSAIDSTPLMKSV